MDPSFERAEERSRARSFVLRSDASRPGSWLEEHREYEIKREDETEERVLVSEANSRSFSQLSMLHSPRS